MGDLGVLIPIIAVATGFLAVFGRVIVKPILQSMAPPQNTGNVQQLEARIAQLEARLAGTEGTVETLMEEREFMRRLATPVAPNRVASNVPTDLQP